MNDRIYEPKPTPDEARVLMQRNPQIAGVLTTEGRMHRDGSFDPPEHLQSHANMHVTGQPPRPGETPSWQSPNK